MNVTIIHENDDWLPSLRDALDRHGVPFDEWFVHEGHFDVLDAPPDGVFFNRMSASSHTRGHTSSVSHTRQILAWLRRHGRRVVNGLPAFELEMSKVRQYQALAAAGVRVPATRAVAGGADALIEAASDVPPPFVTKHNRGGKGLGVQLFNTHDAFAAYARSDDFIPSPDHITLLQQYIEAAEPQITRCEFVGGTLVYALTADTREGFELCPAEACRTEETCTIDGDNSLFDLRTELPARLVAQYERFLAAEHIDVAGVEFIEDVEGRCWTYDVNGTTNYNPEIESAAEQSAWDAVAQFLGQELQVAA
ncbi:ATP-grasp domain-containing protein [Longibacter sp.]|uniref:ATP-grasp domain-containing protein n=1 Tax=Longibacter sp. TaxID=2045415 RepID=UPI003EBBED8F